MKVSKNIFIGLGTVLIIGIGYLGVQYFLTFNKLKEVESEFAAEKSRLAAEAKQLEETLAKTEEENVQLADRLQEEKERNDSFEGKIQSISSTVGVLEKLSKTDEELLQKYSKIYFLNENYIPDKLVEIDEKYLYEKNKKSLIHANAQKYLYNMMDDAEFNGVPLEIVSAHRSFGEQWSLKGAYLVTYGVGANKFSADQGYSEHQLGTAVDFTTPDIAASFTGIESTPAYKWLLENAYRYGFILSYPKDNTYYQFEPWHWRFVGVTLAAELHKRNINFYDMNQREIDTYLVSIFD